MPVYNLQVLGLELSFSANISEERLGKAVELIEKRYRNLESQVGLMSKERLLTYLALSLADDYLHDKERLCEVENSLAKLISKIDCP
jgi:cell division protein ZapA